MPMSRANPHSLIILRQIRMILALLKLFIGILFLYLKIKRVISKFKK